jgi:competence protein ComEC
MRAAPQPAFLPPFALAGSLVWIGATGAAWLPPSGPSLLMAVVALGLLGLLASRHQAAVLAWWAGCLLLGCAAVGLQPQAPALGGAAEGVAVLGTVETSSGWRAQVGTDKGRLELLFNGPAPAAGDRIAAWTTVARGDVVLPGAPDDSPNRRRAGVEVRRAQRWVPIGAPSPPRVARADFLLARNGALLWALATGQRAEVDPTLMTLMRRTGTRHLLSISGMHLGLVGGLAGGLAALIGRLLCWLFWASIRARVRGRMRAWVAVVALPRAPAALAAIAAIGTVFAYGATVDWPTSARRAAWMVAAAALGHALGRRASVVNLLGLAAAILVLRDPAVVGEVGAQLSFGAVLGIALCSSRLTRLVPPDAHPLVGRAATALGATLGATLGTLPIVAWHFQELGPTSPLANLLAGPLIGGVGVPAALLARLLPAPWSLLPLAVGDAAVQVAVAGLERLDVVPWAPAVGPIGALGLVLVPLLRRRPAAALLVASLCLWMRPVPADRLVVTFLAVGQGDAALIEWPDGQRWLIDGGPDDQDVLHYLRSRGIRQLDVVALSHPHPDHMRGLPAVVGSLEIGVFWTPRGPLPGEVDYQSLWGELAASRVPVIHGADLSPPVAAGGWARAIRPSRGQTLRGGRHTNDESLVIHLGLGATGVLFLGDAESDAEMDLMTRGVWPVTVVKVGHHGSRTSSTWGLVAATGARLAVISCGVGNSYGHPNAAVLGRWLSTSAVARTDQDGTVEVGSDGSAMTLRAWTGAEGWRSLEGRLAGARPRYDVAIAAAEADAMEHARRPPPKKKRSRNRRSG